MLGELASVLAGAAVAVVGIAFSCLLLVIEMQATREKRRPHVDSVERMLAQVGDAWTLLILREAFFGVRRFDGFQENLAAAPNILADRLKKLVAHGLLERSRYQERPPRSEYRLTKKGLDLYPAIVLMMTLGRSLARRGQGCDRGKTTPYSTPVLRRSEQLSFKDYRMRTGRGGPRPGAGRPRGPRPRVLHRERERIPGACPVHVTVRMRPEVPSLRSRRLVRELRRSFAEACERGEFRVVHYSLQRDHAHLIVEARGKEALARGMKSVGARLARAVNRVFGRTGGVLDGRFHHRVLRTPREVRNALAYVLLNARRHWAKLRHGRRPPVRLDEASSARWFEGWRPAWRARLAPHEEASEAERPEIAPARTWLLRIGWRRHGLLDPSELPGTSVAAPA